VVALFYGRCRVSGRTHPGSTLVRQAATATQAHSAGDPQEMVNRSACHEYFYYRQVAAAKRRKL